MGFQPLLTLVARQLPQRDQRSMKRKNNSLLFYASSLTTLHVHELFIPPRML